MIGIVVVSHSHKLAEGAVELASQMVQGKVPLAAAGGVDDPENPIGTDATKIKTAIESVYSQDGVVVLMDLGSAILSAELALELLDPAQAAQVHLCAAPLVEGTLAAAVQASVGSDITAVIREAEDALTPKRDQLGLESTTATETTPSPTAESTAQAAEITLTIQNRMGLHARPAARFVATANRFEARITVSKGEKSASAKSINQVATLGVRQGETITVTAVGPDSEDALAALQTLVADHFGEKDAAPAEIAAPITAGDADELAGIGAAPGVAVGPVVWLKPTVPEVPTTTAADAAAEWQRLQTAVDQAVAEIQQVQTEAARRAGAAEADIFAAHQLILQDPALLEDAQQRLQAQQLNAAAAWQQAYEAVAADYEALDDPYLRARAADVRDVGQRVLQHLLGVERPSLTLTRPSIIAAADLTPSATAQLEPEQVLGILTERGGVTSHSAILARGLGIPAVVGVGPALSRLAEGEQVGLNGQTGEIWPNPNEATRAELATARQAWLDARVQALQAGQQPAVTQDGRRVEIGANIGGPAETAAALENGAEGVGLFRTEFLFMERPQAPDEEEQFEAYRLAAASLGRRPLIIRTLDVGGDKPLPYLDLGVEENPFLGWRGIRFCLDMPQLFKPQLRAILRASHGHNVKLMFPMIGTLDELKRAKAILDEARQELRRESLPFDEAMEVGIMIEVPAAVAIADQLAAEVDFFSIGTNDLTQYVMAADRGNANVAALVNALQPAVLRQIQRTVQAAHDAGIWVGMCGELAGNPTAAPVLVGLGLDELSMAAPAIPQMKQAIRRLTLAEAQKMATAVLTLSSAADVLAYL